MIKKIESIKNLMVFNGDYKQDKVPEFKQHNLIYGWNASGKTTLSKFFKILESGKSEEFKDLKYKVKTSNETLTQGTSYEKKILVFNEDFISQNIRIVSSKANLILILGEKSAKIIEQIKKDNKYLEELKDEIKKTEESNVTINKERGKEFTNIAKVIGQALIGLSVRDYRKNNAENDFITFFPDSTKANDAILKQDELDNKKSTLTQEQKDKINEVQINKIEEDSNLSEVLDIYLKEAEELCLKTVGSTIIQKLQENKDTPIQIVSATLRRMLS